MKKFKILFVSLLTISLLAGCESEEAKGDLTLTCYAEMFGIETEIVSYAKADDGIVYLTTTTGKMAYEFMGLTKEKFSEDEKKAFEASYIEAAGEGIDATFEYTDTEVVFTTTLIPPVETT